MAVDKLVDSTQLDSDLTSVANAIRAKSGGSSQLAFPAGFVSEIQAIPSGGGGEYTAEDFADATKPTGAVAFSAVYFGENSNNSPAYFGFRSGITKLFGTNYAPTGNNTAAFRQMPNLQYAIFPKATKLYNNAFYGCTKLEAFDWLGGQFAGSGGTFQNCSNLTVLVVRKSDAICTLGAVAAFTNSPFASGKAGGTLYVPSALISSYQAATNWSTILGYANNQIKSIESTHTDPNAPIDLTLYYVDGTPIPTT